MNPTATVRLRRATAAIALIWALVAFGLSIALYLDAEHRYGPPFLLEGLATDPWSISGLAPEAAAAGLVPGDQLVSIDGRPVGAAVLLVEVDRVAHRQPLPAGREPGTAPAPQSRQHHLLDRGAGAELVGTP